MFVSKVWNKVEIIEFLQILGYFAENQHNFLEYKIGF